MFQQVRGLQTEILEAVCTFEPQDLYPKFESRISQACKLAQSGFRCLGFGLSLDQRDGTP